MNLLLSDNQENEHGNDLNRLSDTCASDKENLLAICARADRTRQAPVSRRGFLAMLAGTGLVMAGGALAPGVCIEAVASPLGGTSIVIYVVSRKQVAITMKNISDELNPVAIPGAKVQLLSYYTNTLAPNQTTNEKGAAIYTIDSFSEPPDPAISETVYQFWGKLLISAEGYRTYETGMVRIVGGSRVDAPTMPIKPGEQYIQCLTMDDFDIQYASGDFATFVWTKTLNNPKNHSLRIRINVGTAASDATFTVGYNHGPRVRGPITDVKITAQKTGLKTDAEGIVDVIFDDLYFCGTGGDGKNFLLDGELDVFFEQESTEGSKQVTCVTQFKLQEGALDEQEDGEGAIPTKLFTMAGKASGLDVSCVLPDDLPVLRSVKISCWYPTIPVRYSFSPFGKLALGFGCGDSAKLTYPNGKGNPHAWQSTPVGSAREQLASKFEKYENDFKKAVENNSIRKRDGKTFGKPDIDKKLQVSVAVDGLLELDWDKKKQTDGSYLTKWAGKLLLSMNFAASLSVTMTTTIGPVPVFLVFELGAALGVACQIGVSRPDAGVDGFEAYMEGNGVGIDLKFSVSLTLGVGIPGVISGGVRGSGYLRLYVGFVVPPQGKAFPHGLIGGGISADLVFQVLIFKVNATVYNNENPKMRDNWANNSSSNGNVADLRSNGPWQSMNPAYQIDNGAPSNDKNYGRIIELDALPNGGYGLSGPSGVVSSAVNINDIAVPVKRDELLKTCEQAGAQNPTNGPAFLFSSVGLHHTGARCTNTLKSSGVVGSGEIFKGAEPSCVKILQDVFSDPRAKVVITDTGTFLFRLASVRYGEGDSAVLRSRVCISALENDIWVDKGPLSFNFSSTSAQLTRKDVFDYDFDVVANHSLGRVYLVIIAGTRPADESNIKLDDMTASTLIISVVLDENLAVRHDYECYDYYNLGASDGYRHTLMFPRAAIDAENNVLFSFLHRKVPEGQSFFSGTATIQDYPAFVMVDASSAAFFKYGSMSRYVFESSVVDSSVKKDVQLHVVGGNFFGDEGGVAFSFITFDQSKLDPDTEEVNKATEAIFTLLKPDSTEKNGVRTVALGSVPRVSVIRAWSGDGKSIAKQDSNLIEVSVEYDDYGEPKLIVGSEPLLEGFHVDIFDVSGDGSTVYYTKVREGKEASVIDDATGETTPGPYVSESQIFASRKVRYAGGNKLISPYPLAKIETPPDQITTFGAGDTAHFIYSTITNLNESKADIYYSGIPLIKNLKLISFQSENSYVVAGEAEPLVVTVQNIGNTVLTQFSIEVSENGNLVDTILVKIHPSITLMNVDDIKKEEPLAQASVADETNANDDEIGVQGFDPGFIPCETGFDIPTQSGVLLPGKTRSYRVNLTIPAAWGSLADQGQEKHTLSARVLCDETLKLAGEVPINGEDAFSELPETIASVKSAATMGLRSEVEAFTSTMLTVTNSSIVNEGLVFSPNYYYQEGKDVLPLTEDEDSSLLPTALAALGVAMGAAGIAASTKKDSSTTE